MSEINITQALHDERFFKPLFKDIKTWHSWEVYLQALFGLPIDMKRDGELLRHATGLEYSPNQRFKESYVICGRRSGKSFISAVIAVYLATFRDWSKHLAPGERGWIFIIANDRQQAKIIKNYISDMLRSSLSFKKMVRKDLSWEIELNNSVNIAVKTCNYRTLRGYTVLAAILEEVAFWRSDDSANPDKEILTAVRPALATIPDSLLIGISTPYSKRGVLFEAWKEHFGQTDGPLIFKAKTELMNPTIDKGIIAQALKDDPQAALAEWQAEWRKDVEAFITPELVEAATIEGRYELRACKEFEYVAFADPSGGRQDSFTLGIAHREEKDKQEKVVLDVIREEAPPLTPENVVADFSKTMKDYGIDEVECDRYAGDWVTNSFERQGVLVRHAEKTKSEIYKEFLPLLTNGTVELLDNKKLAVQLTSLERKTRAGGRDSIDNFYGHDDVANSAAGACVRAFDEEGLGLADRIEWI